MKVSIIVVCQNEEENIAKCLESVLNQSYASIEIIVVDSSSDPTPQIVKEFQQKSRFPFEVIFKPEGTSIARKRNLGLAEAKGDLVSGLDADETMPPWYIEEVVRAFDSEKVLGVWTRGEYGKPDSRIGKLFYFFDRTFYPGETEIIPGNPDTCATATVCRTSFIRSLGGHDVSMHLRDDTELWGRMKKRIIELNKEGGYYIKRLDKPYFVEYKRAHSGFWNHLRKMAWYGYLGIQDVRSHPEYSFRIVFAPLYFSSTPVLLILLSFRAIPLWLAFLTIPFFAMFPYSLIMAVKQHVPSIYSLTFPFLMILKAVGASYGILEYLFSKILGREKVT